MRIIVKEDRRERINGSREIFLQVKRSLGNDRERVRKGIRDTQRLDLKLGVGERNRFLSIQFLQIYNALLSDV